MNQFFYLVKFRTLPLILFFFYFNSYSQISPGLIFEPATGTGRIVLDPNLDGYISTTTAGFSGVDDQTAAASEIPFQQMPLISEPTSDLGAGPSCKYTDYVRDNSNVNMSSTVGYYLDANNNFIFRMRLASYSPNTKSYSILIDIDGKFGNSGPNADPEYVAGNPGFEIEILMSTNNGVYVYDVNNNTNNSVLMRSYNGHDNYQKAKALSTVCGSPNMFLDLFVPFGDLTTDFGITSSTPLRWAAADNMSANQSTIGHLSNISDIAGVDGSNNEAGLASFINSQTPTCATCAPGGLRSACPEITAPISKDATSVSGTSTEAVGTTITLYINGVKSSFTTTVVSGGGWTISSISPPLSGTTPDLIGATAKATGKGESIYNCNIVTVKSCTYVPPLSSGATINGKYACGNAGVGISGATISVYLNGTLVTPGTNNGVNINGEFLWACATGATGTNCTTAPTSGSPCLTSSSNYEIFQTVGGCVSESVCRDPNNSGGTAGTSTAAPTISTTPITTATTSISGTCVSGATIFLYADGVQIGTVTGTTTWTISSLTLTYGQIITAKARVLNECTSLASASKTVKNGNSTAPIIDAPPCGTTSMTVSGTSGEASGTSIQLRDSTAQTTLGTTTVGTDGTWSISGLSLTAGNVLGAYATIAGGSRSISSSTVTVATKSTNAVAITGSYTNQSTSVSGTGTNGDVIRLYVDGAVLDATTVVSGGTWTIPVSAGQDLFKDVEITATATTGSNCESNPSAGVTVTLVAPTAVNVAQTVSTCNGIAEITVPNTESGVLYQVYDGATPFSNGVVGNGGTITLLSSFVNTTKTGLTVEATNIIDEASTNTMTGTVTINIMAADSTWTGAFSNDWFDYRNWCLNGEIPTSTVKAKILSGTPFSPIIDGTGAVCDTLILYSGATLTSTGSNNLDVYGSWINNGGTFTPNDGTVTFKGTDNLDIGGTSSTTFNNLTVNLTGSIGDEQITLNQPTTITGLLTLTDGRINTTSTNILELTSTASSTAGSDVNTSFVNGPMTKTGTTAFVFPVGSGTDYGPIGIGTPTSSTTFQAEYINSSPANITSYASSPTPALQAVSSVEYWNLTQTGSADAAVELFWQNSTTSGVDNAGCSDLQQAHWNGSAWENVDVTDNETISGCPGTIASSGSIATSTDVPSGSFGLFTFGSTSNTPVPVDLISFKGICINKDVKLKWATATELNNSFFTVERGTDGTNFIPIAEVAGSGNSNQIVEYEFIDNGVIRQIQPEDLYYRLKQTDFNGEFEYFLLLDKINCGNDLLEILVYPTISNGNIVIMDQDRVAKRIEVYNTMGRLEYSAEIVNTRQEIFLNLRSGMYRYILTNNNDRVGKGTLIIE